MDNYKCSIPSETKPTWILRKNVQVGRSCNTLSTPHSKQLFYIFCLDFPEFLNVFIVKKVNWWMFVMMLSCEDAVGVFLHVTPQADPCRENEVRFGWHHAALRAGNPKAFQRTSCLNFSNGYHTEFMSDCEFSWRFIFCFTAAQTQMKGDISASLQSFLKKSAKLRS